MRASRTAWAPTPPTPQMRTAWAERTCTVPTRAAYEVETASGMIAAWPKGSVSGMGTTVSSRAIVYWGQPPS
ncbi:hypothetical protein HEP87_63420 [Streptomyces sp. S1D4-11]